MNRKLYQQFADQVRALPKETILAAAYRCNGHTIFKPQAFLDAGLPQAVVDHVTHTHKSDGSPKGTIFIDGQPVKQLAGVYGLNLLRFLNAAPGVEYADAIGRGSQAHHTQAALMRHVDSVAQ